MGRAGRAWHSRALTAPGWARGSLQAGADSLMGNFKFADFYRWEKKLMIQSRTGDSCPFHTLGTPRPPLPWGVHRSLGVPGLGKPLGCGIRPWLLYPIPAGNLHQGVAAVSSTSRLSPAGGTGWTQLCGTPQLSQCVTPGGHRAAWGDPHTLGMENKLHSLARASLEPAWFCGRAQPGIVDRLVFLLRNAVLWKSKCSWGICWF